MNKSIIIESNKLFTNLNIYQTLDKILNISENNDYVLIKNVMINNYVLYVNISKTQSLFCIKIRNTEIYVKKSNVELFSILKLYFSSISKYDLNNFYDETCTLFIDIITKFYYENKTNRIYKVNYTNLSEMVLDIYYFYNKLPDDYDRKREIFSRICNNIEKLNFYTKLYNEHN